MVDSDYAAVAPINLNHCGAANARNTVGRTVQRSSNEPEIAVEGRGKGLFAADGLLAINGKQNRAGNGDRGCGVWDNGVALGNCRKGE